MAVQRHCGRILRLPESDYDGTFNSVPPVLFSIHSAAVLLILRIAVRSAVFARVPAGCEGGRVWDLTGQSFVTRLDRSNRACDRPIDVFSIASLIIFGHVTIGRSTEIQELWHRSFAGEDPSSERTIYCGPFETRGPSPDRGARK